MPNTNTALPYIDIVNETLEYFVANNLSLNGFTGFNTPDAVTPTVGTNSSATSGGKAVTAPSLGQLSPTVPLTSTELLAAPQNVNNAAYTILQAAFFPSPLPFHRPLALLSPSPAGHSHVARGRHDRFTRQRCDRTCSSSQPFGWRNI